MSEAPHVDLEHAPILELQHAAELVLSANVHGYYATGARDGRTLVENEAAWGAWWLRPRRLTGVSRPSLGTTLLGRDVRHPPARGPRMSGARG